MKLWGERLLISPEYRALNAELHARDPRYGISGDKWSRIVCDLGLNIGASTVLDYGSGKGTLRRALFSRFSPASPPFEILEFDPAIPGKDHRPGPADLVVCGDVLEHIEPDCLYAVLDDIRGLARAAVMLVVATRPAQKVLADGRNAHLIVEPSGWWLRKIVDRWRLESFKDFGGGFICVGRTL